MFELPSDVPNKQDIVLETRSVFSYYLHRVFGIGQPILLLALRNDIDGLNRLLRTYREGKNIANFWQHGAAQEYINECCRTLGIPIVRIHSNEQFNLEQTEAVFLTNGVFSDSVYNILRYMHRVLLDLAYPPNEVYQMEE